MGLLDGLVGQVLGGLGQNHGASEDMVHHVLGMLGGQGGSGLTQLMQVFQSKGLGDVIGSWVGTGQNLPIDPQQLMGLLGNDQVAAMASKFGLTHEAAASQLANLLPQVIDKMTPNGELPGADVLSQGLGGLLGKLF